MAERLDPDAWMRFSDTEIALLRTALTFRIAHDRRLDSETRRAMERLNAALAPPDPIMRDIGED